MQASLDWCTSTTGRNSRSTWTFSSTPTLLAAKPPGDQPQEVALIGQCLIKHWSKTQTTISLSSGEAELHGIAHGAAQGLGMQSLLVDLGWHLKLRVHSDATAAIGICRRKSLGKIRHLAMTDLWIQDKVRSKQIELLKVLGADNPADVLTKYVNRQSMDKAMAAMNMRVMHGRPACAPAALGV